MHSGSLAGWEPRTVDDLFELQLGKMLSAATRIGPRQRPYLANRNVQWNRIDLADVETMHFDLAEDETYSLRRDDVLICEGGDIGRTAIWNEELANCHFQNAVHRLRPTDSSIAPRFFLHFMRFAADHGLFRHLSGRTSIAHLTKEGLGQLTVCVPPPSEQRGIVAILDTVDDAIRSTDRLIAKLELMKRGLLQDLLTRGIGENGELRDPQCTDEFHATSLGLLPKAWRVIPLRACVRSDAPITYGIVQAGPHIEGGVPYIRTGDMAGESLLREGLLCTSTRIAKAYARSTVSEGDIVCAIRATVGKVLPVPRELDGANLTQGTARISPGPRILPDFLLWALRSHLVQREFALAIKGTTFAEITLAGLRELVVPVPVSRDEQRRIAESMAAVDRNLEAERRALRSLDLLKKGIADDLLTGRVRVPADDEDAA